VPVDRDQIFAATAEERRRIAGLIETLDEAQLATTSLCGAWDVKTVGAHLVSVLTGGTRRVQWLMLRYGSADRAMDELARRTARLSAAQIAASLRGLADHRYWRPPPQATGLLAEVLVHSGDIRIPLGLPFEPDPQLSAVALDFLTSLWPVGVVPLGRLRGIRWQATDIGRSWGDGQEVRGPTAALLMATVGRTVVLDRLAGPGMPLLRRRIGG
jgi:uncharacterized protein (TIGR03083 family)